MDFKYTEKYNELATKIQELSEQQRELGVQIRNLKAEQTALRLLPYKIGDKVWCNIQQGKTKKETICVIEIDDGVVYVRPYKKDGQLSDRRFSVWEFGSTYAEQFRKVEE